jgi:major membrane immunogen (membrane-anchored lipoprotein)
MTSARRGWVAVLVAATLIAACGQSKAPNVDAAAERREATERAKQGPYGTQMKSLDAARDIEADINKKAQEQVDRIEKDAK